MNQEENKKIYTKKCKHCGKEFETRNSLKLYCSEKCKSAAGRDKCKNKLTRTCPICGKEFTTYRSTQVYCSSSCKHKNEYIQKKKNHPKEVITKVCVECGSAFIPNRSDQIYCGKKCQQRACGKSTKHIEYMQQHKEERRTKAKIYNESRKDKMKAYSEANKERIKAYQKQYRSSQDKDKIREYNKKYHEANKERIKEKSKIYYKNNKDRILEYHNKYERMRRRADPEYRISKMCRRYIRRCLSGSKTKRTQDILGYKAQDLIKHIEGQFYGNMNWNNTNTWEVHHIKPLDTFNFLNEDGTDNYDTIREANTLNNLIPLFIEDHKKVTSLYTSDKRILSLEEIQELIIGKD